MELTVSALRNTYKILGGTETDITDVMTIPEALNKVNTKLAAFVTSVSAGLLPTVSAPGDVGKVLKVNDEGKWAPGTDEIQA